MVADVVERKGESAAERILKSTPPPRPAGSSANSASPKHRRHLLASHFSNRRRRQDMERWVLDGASVRSGEQAPCDGGTARHPNPKIGDGGNTLITMTTAGPARKLRSCSVFRRPCPGSRYFKAGWWRCIGVPGPDAGESHLWDPVTIFGPPRRHFQVSQYLKA